MSLLNWFLTALLWAGALSGWVFLIVYSRRSAWWHPPRGDKNREHRAHLGIFTLALTLLLTLYGLRPLFGGNMEAFAYARAPLFAAVPLCMVWRLVLLLRSKRVDRLRTDREDAARDVG